MAAEARDLAEVQAALLRLDTAFATGDLDTFASLLAEDVHLLLHHQETIVGHSAVQAAFRDLFASVDTSAYRPDHHTIEVQATGAYVMSEFAETLRPYDGSPAIRVRGRGVFFWRRTPEGWKVTRMLTARSAPDEEVP